MDKRGGEDTPTRIMEAFKGLLQETDYDKITVVDICERAGVSRKTLYVYFDGKEGVLRGIVRGDVVTPIATMMDLLPMGSGTAGGKMLTQRMLETIYDNRDFYGSAVVQGRIGIIGQVMREVLAAASIDLFRGETGNCSEKYRYAAHFTAGANVGVITEWLRSGLKVSPEELTDWLFEFSQSGNRILLDPMQ